MPKLLGFQFCNTRGENIAGDEGDISGLASFEIMSPALMLKLVAHLRPRSLLIAPIYEGDIQEPTIVNAAGTGE